ncbi:MAG TPA: outer membrane lipoprotein-sorting protein [Caulobacteraceae bacterium]|nr:outer membrane lipoprotein-sorting protein [Caulobacteraceae bacterium]
MRRLLLSALAALAAAGPALAAPAPNADQILQRAFDNYRAKTSQTTVAMTIHRPTWERRMGVTSWTRGETDALVRFTAPPADAGNATLKLGNDTWVYNPKLNQVIKLPASMMSQSWMGSDFSYNDLSKSEDLLTSYTHRLIATEQAGGHTVWTIESTPKPGAPIVWGKVTIKIRDDSVILEETFFDQDMRPARRMTADKVGVIAGRPYPVSLTMQPLDKPGQWTRVETQAGRFDAGAPAYLFTLSNLQNPRS